MNAFVTPLYAAILALLFVALSARVIRLRRRLQIAIGDAGEGEMTRAMRVHSNFAEYAPLTLLLIFMLEIQAARPLLVHGLCICLLLGRIVHAYGVSQTPENIRFRVTGMILTFTALVGASTSLLVTFAPRVWS